MPPPAFFPPGSVLPRLPPRRAHPCFIFSRTPHATRGPPLTPDFSGPVIPWSGFAWMMSAVPSSSKTVSGPLYKVIRVVVALAVASPSPFTSMLGRSPMWNGWLVSGSVCP